MIENRDRARAAMLLLLEAMENEAERESISTRRVSALADAISALTPLVQSNW